MTALQWAGISFAAVVSACWLFACCRITIGPFDEPVKRVAKRVYGFALRTWEKL